MKLEIGQMLFDRLDDEVIIVLGFRSDGLVKAKRIKTKNKNLSLGITFFTITLLADRFEVIT